MMKIFLFGPIISNRNTRKALISEGSWGGGLEAVAGRRSLAVDRLHSGFDCALPLLLGASCMQQITCNQLGRNWRITRIPF